MARSHRYDDSECNDVGQFLSLTASMKSFKVNDESKQSVVV